MLKIYIKYTIQCMKIVKTSSWRNLLKKLLRDKDITLCSIIILGNLWQAYIQLNQNDVSFQNSLCCHILYILPSVGIMYLNTGIYS